jgi:hypothetical protein
MKCRCNDLEEIMIDNTVIRIAYRHDKILPTTKYQLRLV